LLAITLIFAYPVIFVGAGIALLAYVLDEIGLHRLLGLAGLFIFVVISFGVVWFFLAYAWPHISPVVDRVLDQFEVPEE
jgi:hypothetical protein